MALVDSPFRCYFTLVDPYTIKYTKALLKRQGYRTRLINEQIDLMLERNLKAASMLHEQVVFRATALLSPSDGGRQHARHVITEAKALLEKGALVPEVRAGDEPLTGQLCNSTYFGLDSEEAKECMPLAEIIDGAKNRHEANAHVLSRARSAQLIDHVFRQWYFRDTFEEPYLKAAISYDDLDELFSILLSSQPVDRSIFYDKCCQMYQNSNHGTLLLQTIYFAMGALAAEANPIFPNHLTPSETLWKYPDLELGVLKGEALTLADTYGITERLALPRVSEAVSPEKVLNVVGIHPDVLDRLNWNDVLYLRERAETINVRDKIWNLCQSGDQTANESATMQAIQEWSGKLTEEVLGERARLQRVANFQLVNNALGILVGMVPVVGTIMSFLGLGVDVGMRQSAVATRFTPLLAFSELVKNVAYSSNKSRQ
jgi:hypothetical protein